MKIKIFVPNNSLLQQKLVYQIAETITKLFNGCTIYPKCLGLWLNPKTKQIEQDSISVIEIFLTSSIEYRFKLYQILNKIRTQLNQQCVAYSIDNEIFFYP